MTTNHPSNDEALRSMWGSQVPNLPKLDEECSPTKVCKNMKGVTFDGFAEPGSDLAAAWRDRLAREGKLRKTSESIRDVVLGDGRRVQE